MDNVVRSKVIRIGNSRGIRIPRALLEQAGLTDEVEMTVDEDKLIIHPVHGVRKGWADRFADMADHGDDHLLDEILATKWENEEWTW